MRSLVFFILVAFSGFLLLAQAFRSNFEHKLEEEIKIAISSSTISSTPPEEAEAPPSSGAGFRGPIGKPYIIGPTADPPNR